MAVYMDTEAVGNISEGFGTAADVLQSVSKALEVAMQTLRATAFIGLVGGLAVERYLSAIKPQIDNLAEYCQEINGDLKAAIEHFENGDEEGASRFY